MSEEFCPCCGNRCPRDSLRCGRGRAYFGDGESRESHAHGGGHAHGKCGAQSEDETVTLLRRCGHLLHHGGGENLLDGLSDEEKQTLKALLEKCLGE